MHAALWGKPKATCNLLQMNDCAPRTRSAARNVLRDGSLVVAVNWLRAAPVLTIDLVTKM